MDPEARSDAESTVSRLPIWKLLAFSTLLTGLLLVAVEVALGIAGVKPSYYRADPLAGFTSRIPHFVEEPDEDGTLRVYVLPSKRDEINRDQHFPAAKPPGAFRIFCLGGSTTYGHPFFDRTSFCGHLRVFLSRADPSRDWEVVNAGAISYASYRITGVMRELVAWEPDLFIVYTGQNEFLERRTYEALLARPAAVTEGIALLERTRTVAALRAILGLRRPAAKQGDGPAGDSSEFGLEPEVRVVDFEAVGPEAFTRANTPREPVAGYLRDALSGMVDLAEEAGAGILFVVPASNLADFAPFKNEALGKLAPGEPARVESLVAQARTRLDAGAPGDALAGLAQAKSIDEHHAATWFVEGRALLALGRYAEARAAFERALEEDVVPFRAPIAIRETMRDVAAERGVPLVDFEALVAASAPHGIAGEEHFVDHVHPTVSANRDLALAILSTLFEEGITSPAPSWSQAAAADAAEEIWEGIDRTLYAAQLRKLSALLDLVGQPEQARKQALAGVELSQGDPQSLYQAGILFQRHGLTADAVKLLREAATGMPESPWPRAQLGIALLAAGQQEEARRELEASVALDPEVAVAQAHLGMLLTQGGEFEAAAEHLEAALRAEPTANAQINLGIVYTRLRRNQEAARLLREGLRARPDDAGALFHYGLALERSGAREQAAAQYRRLLEVAPDHRRARRRLRALGASG